MKVAGAVLGIVAGVIGITGGFGTMFIGAVETASSAPSAADKALEEWERSMTEAGAEQGVTLNIHTNSKKKQGEEDSEVDIT